MQRFTNVRRKTKKESVVKLRQRNMCGQKMVSYCVHLLNGQTKKPKNDQRLTNASIFQIITITTMEATVKTLKRPRLRNM